MPLTRRGLGACCCGGGGAGPCFDSGCPPINWTGVLATIVGPGGTFTTAVAASGAFTFFGLGVDSGLISCSAHTCGGITYGPPRVTWSTPAGGQVYDTWHPCGFGTNMLILVASSCGPLLIEVDNDDGAGVIFTITFHM